MISPRVRSILAYVAVFAAAGAIVPYLPLYYSSLGFELGEIGAILAVASLVGLLASPLWGALSDRSRGSPVVLLAATATGLVGTAVLAFTTDPVPVTTGAALVWAGVAGLSPIIDARALETSGANRSGYGPLRAWGSFSYIVSALATGVLVEAFGLRALFVVLTGALVATGVVGLLLGPARFDPRLRRAARPLREASRLFGRRGLGLFLLGAFLTWVGMSAVLYFTPLRFVDLGAGAALVGLGGAIAAATEVPVMLRFPALAARFGSERLLVAGAFCIALRSVVATIASGPEVLLAASIFGGIGFGLFFVGGVTYVSTHVPPELAATAQGIFQGVGSSLSLVVATAAGGAVAAVFGLAGLFAVSAGIGVIGTAIIARAVRHATAGADARSVASPTMGA